MLCSRYIILPVTESQIDQGNQSIFLLDLHKKINILLFEFYSEVSCTHPFISIEAQIYMEVLHVFEKMIKHWTEEKQERYLTDQTLIPLGQCFQVAHGCLYLLEEAYACHVKNPAAWDKPWAAL